MGEGAPCPRASCGAVGRFVFTGTLVKGRGIFWLRRDGLAFEHIDIPLCRCEACRGRFRVLPVEILPRKSYSFPSIESACGAYLRLERGLRRTVERMGKYHPRFTTLWIWLRGLGRRVLDRGGAPETRGKGAGNKKERTCSELLPPAAALIAETAKRLAPGLAEQWSRRFEIPAWKYKSPRRRDQLEACARLLGAASFLFPESTHPLTAWQGWLIGHFHVAAWGFGSRISCTTIKLPPPGQGPVDSPARPKWHREERNHGPRSPPGGLLAVRADQPPA